MKPTIIQFPGVGLFRGVKHVVRKEREKEHDQETIEKQALEERIKKYIEKEVIEYRTRLVDAWQEANLQIRDEDIKQDQINRLEFLTMEIKKKINRKSKPDGLPVLYQSNTYSNLYTHSSYKLGRLYEIISIQDTRKSKVPKLVDSAIHWFLESAYYGKNTVYSPQAYYGIAQLAYRHGGHISKEYPPEEYFSRALELARTIHRKSKLDPTKIAITQRMQELEKQILLETNQIRAVK